MRQSTTTPTDRSPARGTASFADHAATAAENYERYFVPAIGAPLAADLVAAAALQPGERVLDVACGTGVVARLAAERVGAAGAVTGVDLNPGMLAVARAVARPGTTIGWHQSSAEAMDVPDAAHDAALCQMGLQFFADKPAALREMRRVLAPGGRLLANLPGPTPAIFTVLERELRDHVSPDAARFVAAVFSLHDARELEGLLDAAGFDAISVKRHTKVLQLAAPADFLRQYVSSTPLAPAVTGLDEQARVSLEREVVARWDAFTDGGRLVLELGVVMATARKQ